MVIGLVIASESVTAAAAAVQRATVTTRASRASRWHCIQKLERIGLMRLLEDLICRSALNDLAFMHDQDLVSYPGDHRRVMADEDGRLAPNLALFQQSQHLCLHGVVESRGRLVGDQDASIDSVEQNSGTSA
ncbi:hypothetical protein IVB56_13100 [Bradyrhizobium sp. CW7]|uniref:hypothetical protein n=1 Tax=Bradyrhizobium sp. CW7 TaxID=2782688 RepID=UPI001FF9D28F|nr:hypothetical protein [Bradyrhizobium sp. CW7]MCK1352013.1 hypothetical protein [Bradyrhizobium sp. CW7]